ncbi:MAG: M48 family metallopeptidase, partial [Myxococcales bacterium]|nr:M48 family metallopeptidase [Myxococcales bacterium]
MSRFLRWVRFLARALLALAMVAGYYALSLVVAAGSVALIVVVVRWHGPSIALVMLGALAVLSLWTAGRVLFERGKQDGDLPGIVLDAAAEPALFSLVADVAREVGTRPPDEIRLIPDANAFVTEVGGTFGFGRRRVLALGYLDLRASNRSELVATIAHELGHFVAGDTALGPLVRRAHTVLV